MAVTGSITTRFVDEKGLDLGKTLIEKDYLISVYPNIVNQLDTPALFGWGANGYGGLGDNTTNNSNKPIQTISFGANWKQAASAGSVYNNLAAIKTDGTLWVCGKNSNGQLGDNTVTRKSSPVQTVAFGTNWKQVAVGHSVSSLESGHMAAIKTDGTLWCWGENTNGQLGDNTITKKSSPVQTIAFGTNWKQVACGDSFTAAIKTDGTLWMWGIGGNGQLGENKISGSASPVQTFAFGSNWKQVSCGYRHTAAVKADGTLWCWGENTSGQLGDNTVTKRSSPVQTVAFGTNWKQVSCGYRHTAAVKTDGTLWCWGTAGLLGDNTAVGNRSSPVQTVTYATNWKQVSCGRNHTGAIKVDGTLWTWGNNAYGQLGDFSSSSRSSPVQIYQGGNTWKNISVGCANNMFAIKDGDI